MSKNCCNFACFFAEKAQMVSTRISVLHRILVPRSEVRLLGGQQKGNPLPTPPHKGGNLMKRGSCDEIHGIK